MGSPPKLPWSPQAEGVHKGEFTSKKILGNSHLDAAGRVKYLDWWSSLDS